MKVLMITNKVKTYALGFQNIIDPLICLGHEVIWAADFSGFLGDRNEIPCKLVQISVNSNPLKPCNLQALKQLCRIIDEERVEAIQCSTPIGGMLGRLAGKIKGVKKVIYAAHGFLFFKGAPLINRTVYKWQESIMARWTDVLITITEEDYRASQKLHLRGPQKRYMVHGAGVEVGKEVSVSEKEKRAELNVPEDAFVITSAGFLNKNKNNRILIEALGILKDLNIYYLICGEGEEKKSLQVLAEQAGVADRVRFLGYRTDMPEIMACTDLFAMPSFREGVPRALLEAMDLGLACIGSRTRGITELLGDGTGGTLCDPRSADDYAQGIDALYADSARRSEMGQQNRKMVRAYSKERVREELLSIYTEVLAV